MTFDGDGAAVLELQTPRMLLRTWRDTDRAEFVRVNQISRELWLPWTPTASPGRTLDQEFDRTFEASRSGMQTGSHCRLVGQLQNGCIAGFFSLSEIVRGVFQNAYAGWRVSADVTGQGYATEGVQALLDLAFAPPPCGLELHRVQANVIPTNAASLRVAAKCGFRREGYAPRYLQIAGEWQDHVMFAKLADEHPLVHMKLMRDA